MYVKKFKQCADNWDSIFDTNVKGSFLVSKAFLPEMMEARKGAIVNITSVSGMFGDYGKYGIRVNNVAPGSTDTSMFPQEMKSAFSKNSPLGRIVEPDEVAKVVFFMSTDDSSAITRETIPVTAGLEISTG